jgi:hypothetical protein
MAAHNIMYKTLGFKWLLEVFCPVSAFATADRVEARNPQRFIHVSVGSNRARTNLCSKKNRRQFSNKDSPRGQVNGLQTTRTMKN